MSTTQFLSSGGECIFDPKTGKHYYVRQGSGGVGYRQVQQQSQSQVLQPSPTSTSTTTAIPSMTATTTSTPWDEPNSYGSMLRSSSPAEFTTIPLQDMTNRSLDKSSMLPVDESLCKKLAALFPSVQEDDLRMLCRRNFNNEGVVMSDLASRGLRSSQTSSTSNVNSGGVGSGGYRSIFSPTQPSRQSTNTPPPLSTSVAVKPITSTGSAPQPQPSSLNTVASADWSSTAPPQWMSAIRRSQSPLANRLGGGGGGSSASSASGSPVPMLQRPCYYPGRFVQGVGFEPSSMGGSPHMSGKPFAPLQGRYALSGMIGERSSSPRVHRILTIPRDPNYGHIGSQVLSQSLAYPGMASGGGGSGGSGPGGVGVGSGGLASSQYSYTVSHAMPPPPPPPTSVVRSSYAYGHVHGPPIPSWYGGEDERPYSGSPQPAPPASSSSSPRLYNVVHDAFVRNRVTDRSACATVLPQPASRTYSPVASGTGTASRERTATPPGFYYQHHQSPQPYLGASTAPTPYHSSQSGGAGGGGSFYATASRLYSQSPKAARRVNATGGGSGGGDGGGVSGAVESSSSSSSPLPHYQVPPRTSQIVASAIYSQQQQAYSCSRTYSPQTVQHHPYQPPTLLERMQAGHEMAFAPVRSSPGPHSPKIKLRYLRRIYPGVDETQLLDILANADNNVQTAMTELNTMGYVKVDTPPIRPASATHQLQQQQQQQLQSQQQQMQQIHHHHHHHQYQGTPSISTDGSRSFRPSPQPLLRDRPVAPPRRLTEADKQKTRARMLEKVKDIPAAILTIALESVDFDEDRAMLLLSNMKTGDKALNGVEGGPTSIEADHGALSAEALQKKLSELTKSSTKQDRKDVEMLSKGTWTVEDLQFRSRYKTDPKGTDSSLRKGPNREFVTNDIFATRKGPNTEMCKGRNVDLLIVSQPPSAEEIQPIVDSFLKAREAENQVKPCGPKIDRQKGPQRSLVQGSTYKFP